MSRGVHKVMVVGATGKLGGLITRALVRRGADVTALIRPKAGRSKVFHDLAKAQNFRAVAGDLKQSQDSLSQTLRGIDTVVSAVNGGEDTVVEGQRNLIRAAGVAGVQRLVPSDFSIDLHRLEYGFNQALDWRKHVDSEFFGRSVRWNPVLSGIFPEYFLSPMAHVVDWKQNTFSYWGDASVKTDFTTMPDTASYVADTVLNPELIGRTIRVSACRLSMPEVHALIERTTGRKLKLVHCGSSDDLLDHLEKLRVEGAPTRLIAALQQHWSQQSGQGRLHPLDNDRFPQIRPTILQRYLAGESGGQVRAGPTP
jgi:uncharacterized protein YbjT (DUF2867 family)